MAATYGYGGEFSSDEDIEQQSDRIAQSKFDSHAQVKPNHQQIETAIEAIKHDQDVNLTDELLAGLLDYYKIQRGPIVDSTRNLYKKIILRLVRDDQQQQASNGDAVAVGNSNGGADSGNNNNNNISSNHNLITKHVKPQQAPYELGSSDEDEPMLPASQSSIIGKKLDTQVFYNNDKIEPMEVDSETPSSQLIKPRQVNTELTSSSSSESSTYESSEDSDSEVLDLTPLKNQAAQSTNVTAAKVNTKAVSTPRERKVASVETTAQTSSVLPAKSNNEVATNSKKKPYTRSQRVTRSKQQALDDEIRAKVGSSKQSEESASVSSGVKPLNKKVLQNLTS